MNNIASISQSALQAFGTSQQVTANNIANMNTEGFNASRAVLKENSNGGVNAAVAQSQDPVDISREAVELTTGINFFTANLKVLETADEMTRELLSIKA